MKRLILATTLVALAGTSVQTVKAGNNCNNNAWNTATQVLTGMAAGVTVVSALKCPPANCSVTYNYGGPVWCPPAPVVYAPAPVFCAPAPVVVYRTPAYLTARPLVVAPRGYYAAHGYGHGPYRHR